MQNWLYAWQRFAAAAGCPGLPVRPGRAPRRPAAGRRRPPRRAPHGRAQPPHARAVRAAARRPRARADDRSGAAPRSTALAANAATDIWDDGVHRECSTRLPPDRPALARRRRRQRPGRRARRPAGAGRPARPCLRLRPARAAPGRHRPRRSPTATPTTSGRCSRTRGRAARPPRPDLGRDRRARRDRRPARRLVSFPVGGYHVQRSGWGDGARAVRRRAAAACFDCGPLGDGGHGHYDQLSVELAGGGRPLVVDPGRYTYADGRRPAGGTGSRARPPTTPCRVDGLDQTPFRPGKPQGRPMSTARLLGRRTPARPRRARGRGAQPVLRRRPHPEPSRSSTTTTGSCTTGSAGRPPHRYEARWHLAPGRVGPHDRRSRPARRVVRAPGLVLAVPAWCGEVTVEDGWVSPAYGVQAAGPGRRRHRRRPRRRRHRHRDRPGRRCRGHDGRSPRRRRRSGRVTWPAHRRDRVWWASGATSTPGGSGRAVTDAALGRRPGARPGAARP